MARRGERTLRLSDHSLADFHINVSPRRNSQQQRRRDKREKEKEKRKRGEREREKRKGRSAKSARR
jgi:hypothetical protein